MSNGEEKGKSFNTKDLLAMAFGGGPAMIAGLFAFLLHERYQEEVEEFVGAQVDAAFNEVVSFLESEVNQFKAGGASEMITEMNQLTASWSVRFRNILFRILQVPIQ